MVTSLTTWLKYKLDEIVAAQQVLSDAEIEQILLNHRIRSYNRACAMRNSQDDDFDVDTDTAMVTVRLHDLTGEYTDYGHDYIYYFHPTGLKIYVNDSEVTTGFSFSPVSLDVVFTTARAADANVEVEGHLVDWRGAMYEGIGGLKLKAQRLPGFGALAKQLRDAQNEYSPRVIRRR
jgi:hypothetical protein